MLLDRFGLSQHQIGLFALAGAGGALAAPLAGRLADRGLGRQANLAGVLVLAAGFYGTRWGLAAGSIAVLVVLAIAIDAAIQTTQIISRRALFALPPETRGRVNAIYMTCLFTGGATGSVAGTITYHWGGWTATASAGGLIGLIVLAMIPLRGRARSLSAMPGPAA
jgi:predicted MFS family arabinose efflux permease